MRPLRSLTWQTRGSYPYRLSQAPHAFYTLSQPGRMPGRGGRSGNIRSGDGVQSSWP